MGSVEVPVDTTAHRDLQANGDAGNESRRPQDTQVNGQGLHNGEPSISGLASETHNAAPASGYEPIAIIGMACRFPGDANSPEEFWDLMMQGRSAMSTFPKEKFNFEAHYHPDPTHGSSVCYLNPAFEVRTE